jgi:hypothetical protein
MRLMHWLIGLAVLPGIFAVCGLAIGACIGTLVPGYYYSSARPPGAPQPDAVGFGMAQGFTQGLVLGIVVALVGGLALVWRWTRQEQHRSLRVALDDINYRLDLLGQAIADLRKQVPVRDPGPSSLGIREMSAGEPH